MVYVGCCGGEGGGVGYVGLVCAVVDCGVAEEKGVGPLKEVGNCAVDDVEPGTGVTAA